MQNPSSHYYLENLSDAPVMPALPGLCRHGKSFPAQPWLGVPWEQGGDPAGARLHPTHLPQHLTVFWFLGLLLLLPGCTWTVCSLGLEGEHRFPPGASAGLVRAD